MINYTPFGHSDWQTIVADIKKFGSAGKKTAVVSTINGDANVPFYKELGNQGIKARTFRSSPSRSARKSSPASTPSRWSAISPPGTTSSRSRRPSNDEFIKKWQAFTKNPKRVTNDPMEAHVIGFDMWVKAVEKAEVDRRRQGDRRAARHRGAEPDRRHLEDAAEPPHHQAGVHRRDQGRRPVRRGVEDRRAWCPATPGRSI